LPTFRKVGNAHTRSWPEAPLPAFVAPSRNAKPEHLPHCEDLRLQGS